VIKPAHEWQDFPWDIRDRTEMAMLFNDSSTLDEQATDGRWDRPARAVLGEVAEIIGRYGVVQTRAMRAGGVRRELPSWIVKLGSLSGI
jgi:hypothetical protein